MIKTTLPLLLLTLALAAPRAQARDESPLAAAARQEQQRRAKLKGTARVVTERDVAGQPAVAPEAGGDAPATATAAPGAGDDATAKREKTDDELRAERGVALQRELDDQRARIVELRRQLEPIEAELADVGSYSLGARRAALTRALEDGRSQIAAAEARRTELEEEARRLGVRVAR